MCGIAGFIQANGARDEMHHVIERMTRAIAHRGPDDSGSFVDAERGVALGHRRLSIIDLSPTGHQPMATPDQRYVISFNGEIYNFRDLRKQLESSGCHFRGTSDTEVLLIAIAQWGIEQALQRANGMFAFALYDRQQQLLYLARDRFGEKPLYYGRLGGTFAFGSELKALRAHPDFDNEIDRDALALLLRHCYIPAPRSIYRKIHKLPVASWATIAIGSTEDPVIRPYWSARAVVEAGVRQPFKGNRQEAVEELDFLLRDAVKLRMVSDVPLGAFLSGGIDSSTIVALMQAQSSTPVRTFSIGFHEPRYNEADAAARVAEHLGTNHTELYVTPAEAQAVIPQLPNIYDEPFADSSQVPTWIVSALARKHVTVSLSGDGGDELFAGYHRYRWGRQIHAKLRWLPLSLRKSAAFAITALSPQQWDTLASCAPTAIRRRLPGQFGDRVHKVTDVLTAPHAEAVYHGLCSHWKNPEELVLGSHEPETPLTDPAQWARVDDFTRRMMYLDTVTYLPDDILVKVDRASMAHSLEARVPLLDPRILAFSASLPMQHLLHGTDGKWVLREVLDRYVPRALVDRPKTGFGVPIDEWLRGPLRDWAEALLDPARLRSEGFFDPREIGVKWQEHIAQKQNWQYYLWDILMFESWLEAQRQTVSVAA